VEDFGVKENGIESDVRTARLRFEKASEIEGLALTGKTMTTKEVADALGVDKKTVLNHAERYLPNKVIEHGKMALWTEAEVTVILEGVKAAQSGGPGNAGGAVKTSLHSTRTSLTPILKAVRLTESIMESYKELLVLKDEELVRMREENAQQAERLVIDSPKAEVLDKITATDSDISVRELASILAVPHLGQNNLFQRLRDNGYVDGLNHPYRRYVEEGLMYEKEYYVPQMEAVKRQLRITQKGVAHFAKKYGGA
jgi:phage antirepressor YoqD-like protein